MIKIFSAILFISVFQKLFLVICLTRGRAYEILHRANKIRFPTESTPLTQQVFTDFFKKINLCLIVI